MELQGERIIPASIETTWASLNDPQVLKACIAGCESLEKTSDDTMTALVAMRIGPVSAKFKGKVVLANIQPPRSYTLQFDGQGGVAGFGKGSADVALEEQAPQQTLLKYNARATVGGKMAQIGARLVDAAAAKITEDFFKAFEAYLQAQAAPVAGNAAANDEPVAGSAPAVQPASTPAAAQTTEPPAGGSLKVWWIVGAIVVLAIAYFAFR